MRFLFIFLPTLLFGFPVFPQTGIKGLLIDSAHNSVLRSATVSVYQDGAKTVDRVSLTDRFGRFAVENLPAEKPMRVEFSFQGFETVVREFRLGKGEKRDLGRIHMPMRTEEIEAVEVLPPVRMNGDTIEFNADAFQLDSNAVVEDLLHKLPGIVVWGDGKITYNGREIPTVLVNGKPFFGTDKSIALQNIAKDAVKKLQVYDKRSQEERDNSPFDPQHEMNVVLKEGKERMYFGNMTAGGGTDERYEGHLNMNYADKRTQSTVAYSLNNVNKNLTDIDQLLRNTTFKGAGIRSDFNPDFLRSGITRQHVFGGRYQYDFLATQEMNRKNILMGSVLGNRYATAVQDVSSTRLMSENPNETDVRLRTQESDRDHLADRADIRYNYQGKRGKRTVTADMDMNLMRQKSDAETRSSTQYDYQNNKSLNEIWGRGNTDNKGIALNARIDIGSNTDQSIVVKYINMKNPHSLWDRMGFGLRLKLNMDTEDSFSDSQNRFRNFLDANLDRSGNRSYAGRIRKNQYDIGLSTRLRQLVFDQELQYSDHERNRTVEDLQGQIAVRNISLSHESRFRRWTYTPRLSYMWPIYRETLTGRMDHSVHANIKMGMRFHGESNSSTLDFRNLEQYFATPLPELTVRQHFSRSGRYARNASLTYRYDEEYPLLDQLRPFYDDINPAYRYFGGERLSKTNKHEVEGMFGHNQHRQHGYNLSLMARYTLYQSGTSDSIVHAENQQRHYTVQIGRPVRALFFSAQIQKSILLKNGQTMGLKFYGQASQRNRPQYLNGMEQDMAIRSQHVSFDLHYTWSDKLMVGWINKWNKYVRKDRLSDVNGYGSVFFDSGMSLSLAPTKRWHLNSNASGRFTTSTYGRNRILIWNASTTYRLTKGNNVEIKLAANDLLRQNKGIYFLNGETEFTSGQRNNLTQYLMFSLAYYPRKFGLR